MPSSRIAVVIVAYRSRDDVLEALAHLGRQTFPPARTVVVENAGGDDTAAAIRAGFPEVEVIEAGENLGFAAGNNRAIARCGDCVWIALLNPDAFPEPEWLAELHHAARRSPAFSFFGSRLVDAADPDLVDGTGDAYHVSGFAWRRDHGRRVGEVDEEEREVFAPCAAAAMYRRDAMEAAGGFDERYFCYFEDVDLAFRLRLSGHRCLSVPSSIVRHRGSASTGRESPFTIYYSHRNLVWTWIRDMPGAMALVYAPQFLASTVLAVGWYATRGQLAVILRAKRDGVRELPRLLRSRRNLQRGRVVSTRGLLGQMARGRSGYSTAAGRARGSFDRNRDEDGGSGAVR